MGYDGSPQPVVAGNTGKKTMTGVLSGNGTNPFEVNPIVQHGVIIGGPSQTLGTLNPVVAGQVLVSGGVAANPAWASGASVGQMVLIQSKTHTGTGAITFTTGITSTYNNYWLRFTDCIYGTPNQVLIRLSSNGGISYTTSNYFAGFDGYPYNATTASNNNTTVGMGLCRPANATDTISGAVWIYNLTSGVGYTRSAGQCTVFATTPLTTMQRTCGANTAINTVWNAIQLINSSGGTTSGTFSLYGVVA
jgi:hypothetical protein